MSASFLWMREKARVTELAMYVAQKIVDNDMLIAKIERLEKENFALQSEDFIDFLNKSRDYAFEYIEKTQAALLDFDHAVKPILDYHSKYGGVLGETPDWNNMESISIAYKKLAEILPENNIPNN
jgi:hypothetical protein